MDASQKGWGFYSDYGRRWEGGWSPDLNLAHISIKELVALYVALKEVRLRKDASLHMFLYYIMVLLSLNRGGTTLSWPLRSWMLLMSTSLEEKSVCGSIPCKGSPDIVVDALSRRNLMGTKWSLDWDLFVWI